MRSPHVGTRSPGIAQAAPRQAAAAAPPPPPRQSCCQPGMLQPAHLMFSTLDSLSSQIFISSSAVSPSPRTLLSVRLHGQPRAPAGGGGGVSRCAQPVPAARGSHGAQPRAMATRGWLGDTCVARQHAALRHTLSQGGAAAALLAAGGRARTSGT
jgi:hypothetical protein